ncbi:MAG: MBL fold metallo-hydrolase [Solidesulfovibrio sp. DCME]|uniref:MBL fold metallo-hydrolase n=1 Tax=Solidesulfovibrio sp. DCME TaxID=3447380 RepID=UPI003D114CFF
MVSRRVLLHGAALAAVTVAGGGFARGPRPALGSDVAAAGRQAPGYFRLRLGDGAVTAIYDGGVYIPPKILHGASTLVIDAALQDSFIDPATGAPTAINAFVAEAGGKAVLIDTGVGTYFGDKAGLLPANLAAAGYEPGRIEAVLLTHLHSDHALGLVDGAGKAVFPKATVYAHEADVAYWLAPGAESRVTEGQRKVLPALRAAVAPYQASGAFVAFADGAQPAGLEAQRLPGHTPGHTGYWLGSGEGRLLAWGDVAHVMAVQLPHPEVTIDFDADQPKAAADRLALLARLAREQCYVAGAHLPFPGIGRIRAAGAGYVWVPALYQAG